MFDFLFDSYDYYKEKRITKRIIPLSTWYSLLEEWEKSPEITINLLGKTYLGEPIHEIVWGKGPIKVAAWSQMHGDEATATMALTDLYNFLTTQKTLNPALWNTLYENITFHCIPFLNKDGAQKWQRETALGIDMNRDAKTQFTQEAKILSDWVDSIKPLFSFNLHDQNRLYSAGNSPYQTQIALLATAADDDNTYTESRMRAAKLANYLTQKLKPYVGNHLAKWSDEYEPRAFGDTFQKRGYGLILFEAGGLPFDLEKQYLRKLNACMLLDSLHLIATSAWKIEEINQYLALPTNEKKIADIKINNAPLTIDGTQRADLIFNIKETLIENEISFSWILEDIGDLSHIYGLTEINGAQLSIIGEILPQKEKEYHNFDLTDGHSLVFQLSHFTNKINKYI